MAERLFTQAGRDLTGIPWPQYPRPSLRRDSFLNLNGEWALAVGEQGGFERSIRVPFPPEALLSGVGEVFPEGTVLRYRRSVSCPPEFAGKRVLLHFGAVDQVARVYLNGRLLGEHTGGYHGFSFDVTEYLQAENTLLVETEDHLEDRVLPYGKQKRNRGGMWYTPVSGIWQTVWMEAVPEDYIRELHFSTGDGAVTVELVGPSRGVLRVRTPEGQLETEFRGGRGTLPVPKPRFWSPEDPYLYRVEIETAQDRVESYFAFRTLETKTVDGVPRLCLNGKPYFFHGVLDQGYWSDGLFTPADPTCFDADILAMKELGFNTLRKHIKVELELYYYACDRLGMVVFQDMVNNGRYSFLRDTALPTLGMKHFPDKLLHRDPETRQRFLEGMEQTVLALDGHPSVCCWTIFNEGWGQFDGDSQYCRLRELDSTRFIDTASGWFHCEKSDVESVHVYFKPVRLKKSEKPLVLSEFGGYTYREAGHVFNLQKSYGYRTFQDRGAYMDALEALYLREVVPAREQGLCGCIYTQLSDVEDEINGLYSYDRAACKVDRERMRKIGEKLKFR